MGNHLETEIEHLQRTARELLHMGEESGCVYANDFSRLNKEIYRQINALINKKGKTVEQEAALCVAILMGYSVSMYANPSDEKKKQTILDRSWNVLELLPASFLKCQLLVYCYGEVYDEELAQEAYRIIDNWGNRDLSTEEREIVDALKIIEECPYPFCVIVE